MGYADQLVDEVHEEEPEEPGSSAPGSRSATIGSRRSGQLRVQVYIDMNGSIRAPRFDMFAEILPSAPVWSGGSRGR